MKYDDEERISLVDMQSPVQRANVGTYDDLDLKSDSDEDDTPGEEINILG